VAEAGAPGLAISNWTAMLTNAAVPRPILAEIERAALAAIAHPETRRRAEEGGFDVLGWSAERSRAFMADEVARWSRVVTEAQIRADG
jgi:tripartite-type tricarboxylate transporter receptor subunit TctC